MGTGLPGESEPLAVIHVTEEFSVASATVVTLSDCLGETTILASQLAITPATLWNVQVSKLFICPLVFTIKNILILYRVFSKFHSLLPAKFLNLQ